MPQFIPTTGVSAGHFILASRDRGEVVTLTHPTDGDVVLVFETRDAAFTYLKTAAPGPIRGRCVPARAGETRRPPTERYALVRDGRVATDLFLACPACGTSAFSENFESLPRETIRCRSCGAALHAREFTPRLVPREPPNPGDAPPPSTLVLERGDETTEWRLTATPASLAGDLTLIARDQGFSQLHAVAGDGSAWPVGFETPTAAGEYLDDLRRDARDRGVATGDLDEFRPVPAAKCGLVRGETHVLRANKIN